MPPPLSRRDAIKLTAIASLAFPSFSMLSGQPTGFKPPSPATDRSRLKLGIAGYSLRELKVEAVIDAARSLSVWSISPYKTQIPWGETPAQCSAAAAKITSGGLAIFASGVIDLPNDEAAVHAAFENARAAGLKVMTCKPAIEALPLVERYVKTYDLRVAIHNHGPEDKIYPSPYDAWKLIQNYDKRVGLCIDVGHSWRAGVDPAEAIAKCAGRLFEVHIKDSIAPLGAKDEPVQVGRGLINIRSILEALLAINYTEVVDFEYERHDGDPVVGLAESIGYVRGLLVGMKAA